MCYENLLVCKVFKDMVMWYLGFEVMFCGKECEEGIWIVLDILKLCDMEWDVRKGLGKGMWSVFEGCEGGMKFYFSFGGGVVEGEWGSVGLL